MVVTPNDLQPVLQRLEILDNLLHDAWLYSETPRHQDRCGDVVSIVPS
jgi:hypothetical protein